MMLIDGKEIDVNKLLSQEELVTHMLEYGTNDRGLDFVREKYMCVFGKELSWYYPISDSDSFGLCILLVKEGFLGIPYNSVNTAERECYETERAKLLDADSIQFLVDNWRTFSDTLLTALTAMGSHLSAKPYKL